MLAGVRLLVVEDDDDTRELLVLALEARHATVRTAANGATAIGLASSWCPDVLLIDLVLPDLDGLKVLAAIRNGANRCSAPAIAISGRASENDRARSLAAGFAKHLAKPARMNDIASAVHEVRARRSGEAASVLRTALESLNARANCRYTSILRFTAEDTLASVWTYDREAPGSDPFPINLAIDQSYCVLVKGNGQPCVISNAMTDPRVASHPKRTALSRYIGVPLKNGDGSLFGTLCSYDADPATVPAAVIDDHIATAAKLSAAIDETFGTSR